MGAAERGSPRHLARLVGGAIALMLGGPSMATAAALAPSSEADGHALPEGLVVQRRDRGQPVSASSLNELVRALGSGHARTRASYEQAAELVEAPDGRCPLARVEVRLDVEVTLPAWRGEPPPPAVEAAFVRVREALRVHEEGHVAIAIEEARRSHAALRAAPPFDDCRLARRALVGEQLRFEQRVRWRNQRYDDATDFGARQGAVIKRVRLAPRRPAAVDPR